MRVRACMVGMVVIASSSQAVIAQTSVDRSFRTTSKDCSGIVWSEEALATYPKIASACQRVEERDGKSFVKFEGTVERNIDRGKQIELRFKDGGNIKLSPGPEVTVYIDGKKKAVKDLARGDQLNFHVPEDRFAAHFAQDASPSPEYVLVPIVYRETVSTYERPRTAAVLPDTASNSAWVLVLGGVFGLIGMMLTVVRRRRDL
jgi:LPXTG-motif cell wall-anchored protein